MIRITNGDGTTELISFVQPDPTADAYKHTDVDGDRLIINDADINDTPGVYFRTDPNGSSVALADLPALVEGIWSAAQRAAHALGVLPCPHPRCGPCSFDRANPKES